MHLRPRTPWLWLALIVVAYVAIAALYAFSVPAWQAPDEPAHYNYIHELAATGQFPVLRMGDYDQAYLERLTGERFPPELPIEPVRYEAHQPPLYYLLASSVFNLAGGSLAAIRLFSVALGALLVVLVYAIARQVYPGQPSLALGAAAFVAFLPMHVAMSASANNDALAEVLLATILLLSIRYVKLSLLGPRPPTNWDALALGLLLGLALITKVSAYVGIPIALSAPLIAWYENRRRSRQPLHASRFTLHVLLIALPALLIALPWYVRNAQVYGNLDILGRRWHDAVVVGQLRTGELLAQSGLAAVLERFFVWSHNSFWGVFGWMGVWMDGRIYTALLAFGLAVVVGVVSRSTTTNEDSEWGRRLAEAPTTDHRSSITDDETRFRRWALAMLALSALLTVGIYVSYNVLFVQPQGRYLFPALPAIGLAVTVGWQEVVWRAAAARWAGLVLLGTAALAGLIGLLREGANKWSLAILGGFSLVLVGWSLAIPRLSPSWRTRLSTLSFALPFAGLAVLDLIALQAFILPQLGRV